MPASLNSLFKLLDRRECMVKGIRIQKQTYCLEERELTKGDYKRLLKASLQDEQLYLILQTICATGIRVSELRYFTVEAVESREITVSCKGKTRMFFLPGGLRKLLRSFAKRRNIQSGYIFRNKNGGAMDRSTAGRSNGWAW